MRAPRVAFWFDFASTYSYPATARIGALARAANVTIDWEPFLLGPIFAELGFKDSPFNEQPIKGRYMWRDLERICEDFGLRWKKPSVFPRNSVLAARVARIVRHEPWFEDFARAVFEASFADDRDIAAVEVIDELLARFGRDGASVREEAGTPARKAELRDATARAKALGLFGAPTMVVGEELFWGNDRIEQALVLAQRQG